jgi:hypothetical protein
VRRETIAKRARISEEQAMPTGDQRGARGTASAGTSRATSGISGGKKDAATASVGYQKGMIVFTIAKGGIMFAAAFGGQKFNYTPHNQP